MRALVLVPALLAILVLATGSPSPGQTTARPNVVVVMSDDQTIESLRVMPKCARCSQAQGTTFSTSFVSFPLCCPSRSTFLTGQYAHNHGVLSNMPPLRRLHQARPHEHAARVAAARRLPHRHIGKYLNGYRQGVTPRPPAGLDGVVRLVRPDDVPFYDYTLNENGHAGHVRRPTRLLPGRRLHRQGRRADSAARPEGATVLPLCRLPRPAQRRPPRARRPARPGNARARPAAQGSLRGRALAHAALVQRGRRLGQAGADQEPPAALRNSGSLR